MPYQWNISTEAPEKSGAFCVVRHSLVLRPHRALSARGFAAFIAATALMLAVPLLALLGTSALWVILAFMAASLAAVWAALMRSNRDLGLTEVLTLTPETTTLLRRDGRGREQNWQANSYWVQVILYPSAGPVPDYLTLKGNDREVELGAFLTPEERRALAGELREYLGQMRQPP